MSDARSRSRLVWSSGPGGKLEAPEERRDAPVAATGPPRVRLERAGRRGKAVTVVEPLGLAAADARELLATLKRQLGTGGTLVAGKGGGRLELQGDHVERVLTVLRARGLAAKRSGG